jgi:ADP-heptose:LPS heptosyltransferase
MSPRAPESVRRIAVLRANGIGDLVFALPALDALRRRFHRAEIVLLGRAWHAELLRGRVSAVDRVEVLPRSALAGAGSIERPDVRAFLDRMRARRFDLGVQLHGGGATSNPLVRALGATTTVGMRTPDADPLDLWIPYVYYQPEILRYLEVVGLLDATAVTLEPMLNVTPADIAASAAAVRSDDGWRARSRPWAMRWSREVLASS